MITAPDRKQTAYEQAGLQEMQVRESALQAAATLMSGRTISGLGSTTLEVARTFEIYILEGRIPGDDS